MTATIVLCLLSSLAFCLSARAMLAVTAASRSTAPSWHRFGFSARAWRVARAYMAFALSVLLIASTIGMIANFIELFQMLP